jgi:predicted nucleic acid-binding protein
VILADTSIWIDYLRGRKPAMQPLLGRGQIAMHPYVIAEIALGSLQHCQRTFALMESLWQVRVASLAEVRSMVEAHKLYSQGIGLTDAHFVASCLITPGVTLWSRDANLQRVAAVLGVQANLA